MTLVILMLKMNLMRIWRVLKQKLKREMKTAVAVETVVVTAIQTKVLMKISTQINKIQTSLKSNYLFSLK